MDDLIARLTKSAEGTAAASQMLANGKSARNRAAGDEGACYEGLTAEQTVEWAAVKEIQRLRAFVDFVNLWAYRESKISDSERLSAIKFHPTARAVLPLEVKMKMAPTTQGDTR